MRLRRLRLRNIRSYGDGAQPIAFDEGITLFQGDIGSGKSTILLAIEFALFGLGETDSTHLLRHGAEEGEVELEFEAAGRFCKASRTLKRTKTGAKVGRCALTVDGREEQLSPSEMKPRVLELVGFREAPDPKAGSVIFRYGVYTPQEEMRSILAPGKQVRELRKQTLRRAFGIEDYKVARDNLALVEASLRERARGLEERSARLDEVRARLEEARGSAEALRSARGAAEAGLADAQARERGAKEAADAAEALEAECREAKALADARRSELERSKGDVRLASERLAAAQQAAAELGKRRSRIKSMEGELAGLPALEAREREVRRLKDAALRLADAQSKARAALERAEAAAARRVALEGELAALPDTRERTERAEGELKEAERAAGAHGEKVDAATRDLKDIEGLKERASCPCCHQPLTAEHLRRLRADLRGRLRESAAKRTREEERAAALREELRALRARDAERSTLLKSIKHEGADASKVDEARRALEALDPEGVASRLREAEATFDAATLDALRRLERERDGHEQVARSMAAKASEVEALSRERERASSGLAAAEAALAQARDALASLEGRRDPAALARARTGLSEASEARRARESALEVASHQLEEALRRASELEEEARELARARLAGEAHSRALEWLRECLGPALEDIERSVMAALSEDMDRSARTWFDMLVEDPDLELAVDEDFSPTVRQQGWDVDVAALSGGERTSVAFAYRLALNGMVRRMAAPGSANVLILDEPTDGFSREQLARMGTVLERLEADQVIIVSHERELDTISDRVYRIEKVAGASTVRLVG